METAARSISSSDSIRLRVAFTCSYETDVEFERQAFDAPSGESLDDRFGVNETAGEGIVELEYHLRVREGKPTLSVLFDRVVELSLIHI